MQNIYEERNVRNRVFTHYYNLEFNYLIFITEIIKCEIKLNVPDLREDC